MLSYYRSMKLTKVKFRLKFWKNKIREMTSTKFILGVNKIFMSFKILIIFS